MRSTPAIDEKLRLRLAEAVTQFDDGSADAFGRRLKYTNGGYIREALAGKKPVREALIDRVHARPEMAGWFNDVLPSSWQASTVASAEPVARSTMRAPRAVPVVGRCQGGFPARIWGDGDQPIGVTDDYAMVATTDDNAFVCQVVGSSMVSRYMPGEYALIEPNTTPEIEDDVLVRLHTGETMLKRLLSRRGGVRLGSYAEAEVFNYPERDITWMYYVAHPIPARRIKHRMEADQYSGEDRRHVERPQRARMVGELVGGMSYFSDLDDGTPPADQKREGRS